MEIAVKLCEKLYSLLECQKQSPRQLEELAEELESFKKGCTVAKCTGNVAAVMGSATVLGAGLLTLFSGGAAAPLLLAAAAASGTIVGGAGTVLSVGATIAEALDSSSTMKKAVEMSKESEELGKDIQTLQEKLNAESPEGYAMRYILQAMANRDGLELTENLIDQIQQGGNLSSEHVQQGGNLSSEHVQQGGNLSSEHVLTFLGIHTVGMPPGRYADSRVAGQLVAGGMAAGCVTVTAQAAAQAAAKAAAKEAGKAAAKEAGKAAGKEAAKAAGKVALKAAVQVGGAFLGLALALPAMMESHKEMVQNNNVTAASSSLRDTAKTMREATGELQKNLDAIQTMIKVIFEVKSCIENLNKYSLSDIERGRKIVSYVRQHCTDETVLQWLENIPEQAVFLNLVQCFYEKLLKEINEEKKKKKIQSEDIDIVIVAHGEITSHVLPARCLMPLPSIKDVILYSPWNCGIDAKVAYGIAADCIQPSDRAFICNPRSCPEHGYRHSHQPHQLPPYWNFMSRAGMIPNIWLGPVRKDEAVWQDFQSLQSNAEFKRILLPYLVPVGADSQNFPQVPLFVLTLVLSVVLMFTTNRATIHLSACLNRGNNHVNQYDLTHQYACTIDHTAMTTTDDIVNQGSVLYSIFRSMFGVANSPGNRRW